MRSLPRRLLLVVACYYSLPALAGFGLGALSTGGESHAMGGAKTAASHSGIGSNANPAGLTGIDKGNLSLYFETFYYSNWAHSDTLGNDVNTEPEAITVAGGGWAHRFDAMPTLVAGFALTAQGGVGFEYPDLLTEAGNRDQLAGLFGVYRLAPALGWQVNDQLSLGVSLGFNYAEAEQKLLPNTAIAPSGAAPGFAGLDLQDVSGWSYSYRLGFQYQISPNFRVGGSYGSATELRLRNGRARVNFPGVGKVEYDDAQVEGFELAEEVMLGFLWQLQPKWQLVVDAGWLNQTESLNNSEVRLSRPKAAGAPQALALSSPIDFQNQLTFSVGVKHQWRDNTDLMLGFAYTQNPIPPENTTPLLSLIIERHFTMGVAHQLSDDWRVIATYYYVPEHRVSYANNGLPLGARSKETAEGHDFTFTLERNW